MEKSERKRSFCDLCLPNRFIFPDICMPPNQLNDDDQHTSLHILPHYRPSIMPALGRRFVEIAMIFIWSVSKNHPYENLKFPTAPTIKSYSQNHLRGKSFEKREKTSPELICMIIGFNIYCKPEWVDFWLPLKKFEATPLQSKF